jgi:hypothetical protein
MQLSLRTRARAEASDSGLAVQVHGRDLELRNSGKDKKLRAKARTLGGMGTDPEVRGQTPKVP